MNNQTNEHMYGLTESWRLAYIIMFIGFLGSVFFFTKNLHLGLLLVIVICNARQTPLKRGVITDGLLLISITLSLFILSSGIHVLPHIYEFNGLKPSPHSTSFNIISNSNELFIALAFLPIIQFFNKKRPISLPLNSLLFITSSYLLLASGVMIAIALLDSTIHFKLVHPNFIGIWLVNIICVSFSEEVLYRGIIQNFLMYFLSKKSDLAVIISSAIYGMMHMQLGWPMVIFCAVCGLLYGYLYKSTRQLWCPILLHICLTTLHFVFFSYPKLA